MYTSGEGVSLDYVSAYVWLMLAAKGGHEASKQAVKNLTSIMTPKQRKEAEIRLAEDHVQGNMEGIVVEQNLPSQNWKP